MSARASVTQQGAIQLGKSIACDAFDPTRPLRIVSHAHSDHMIGLQQSLRKCKKVLMTNATKDLIDVLRGPPFLTNGFVETLDYGKTIEHEGERITFFKADHILGAAQVFVEDIEGQRITYTGDFRVDNTPAIETDVLVMEATYGSPNCKRHFGVDIKDTLISLVEKGLKQGPVYIFGYHGKIQEVMQILRSAKIDVPFIASERIYHVSKACEKNGMHIGRLLISEDYEARDLAEKASPCIVFHHMNAKDNVGPDHFCISVSGWEFDSPSRETGNKEYVVALSDHSDFDGLIEYVRRSKPKTVITDSYRDGHAQTLAREIHKRFGIHATALPN